MATLHLSQQDEADALLSSDPLALLIGMVLDQQVPLEWAFAAPLELRRRLGGRLDATAIAEADPDAVVEAFVARPALHRFPAANAKRVQQLCRTLVDDYGGRAEAVWSGAADGAELRRRIAAPPGFGRQKAQIFVALLGKQLGVRPPGWREAAGVFGEDGSLRSVADITGPDSLDSVRSWKREQKAASKREGTPG